MPREHLILEVWRFTNIRACVRELRSLLESSDYKFILQVRADGLTKLYEELEAELDGFKDMGRVKVERIVMEKAAL